MGEEGSALQRVGTEHGHPLEADLTEDGGACSTAGGAEGDSPEVARGRRVGRYLVLRKLGEGGMGMVFEAYDPELDRRVALKLLRPRELDKELEEHLTRQVRIRLIREARALARLAHPNIVTIYDVGNFEGALFIAMELVEGTTLRQWLETPRTVAAVRDVMCGAGRGLEAAHAAGLVHRDFKPDNVIVDAHGRALVLDFGLVRRRDEQEPQRDVVADSPSGEWLSGQTRGGEVLTELGDILGTPAYMAPEQHRAEACGPAVDQFAFCVSFFEALHGHRPFEARSRVRLLRDIEAGRIRDARLRPRVPLRVQRAILRGLAAEPKDRHGDMGQLLVELGDRRSRAWAAVRLLVVVLSVLVLCLGVVGAPIARDQQCQVEAETLGQRWHQGQRQAIEAAFAATGLVYAADSFNRVVSTVEPWMSDWSRIKSELCSYEASDPITRRRLDLQMGCLQRSRRATEHLIDGLQAADADVVRKSISATSKLADPGHCLDVEALEGGPRRPQNPAEMAELQRIEGELARAQSLSAIGRGQEALALTRQLIDEAEVLDYRPVSAALYHRLALDASEQRDRGLARSAMEKALVLATASGQSDLLLDIAKSLIIIRGHLGRDLQGAAEVAQLARAHLERAGRPALAASGVARARAILFNLRGRPEEAIPALEEGLALLQADVGVGSAREASLRSVYAVTLAVLGRGAAAEREFERSVELFQQNFGDQHPQSILPISNLAIFYDRQGRHVRAIEVHRQALKLAIEVWGPDAESTANYRRILADALETQGRPLEALRQREAIAVSEAAKGVRQLATAQQVPLWVQLGQYQGAQALLRAVTRDQVATHGNDRRHWDPAVLAALSRGWLSLAEALHDGLGQDWLARESTGRSVDFKAKIVDEAGAGYEALKRRSKLRGGKPSYTRLEGWARLELLRGRRKLSEQYFRQALQGLHRFLGEGRRDELGLRLGLARVYQSNAQPDLALRELELAEGCLYEEDPHDAWKAILYDRIARLHALAGSAERARHYRKLARDNFDARQWSPAVAQRLGVR